MTLILPWPLEMSEVLHVIKTDNNVTFAIIFVNVNVPSYDRWNNPYEMSNMWLTQPLVMCSKSHHRNRIDYGVNGEHLR